MSEIEKRSLNLRQVVDLLTGRRVFVDPEDARNPVVTAEFLGLIDLVCVETVETGYYSPIDQRQMLCDGRIIQPVAFGQAVFQAVEIINRVTVTRAVHEL
mgnify:CR=1 FL=1